MSTSRFDFTPLDSISTPELRYVTRSRYDNEWVSAIHSHSVAELIYVSSGEGRILLAGVESKLEEGFFAAIPPHAPHAEYSSDDNPLEYYVLGVANIGLPLGERSVFPLGKFASDIARCFSDIHREMAVPRPGGSFYAISGLYWLIGSLARRGLLTVGSGPERAMRSSVAAAASHIDGHYAEDLSLDALAQIAGVSKYHLIRQFSADLGRTPGEYLLEKRVGEAKKLLSDTEMSIGEIAESVGFSSASYFSQRFSKAEGLSPQAWRKASKF